MFKYLNNKLVKQAYISSQDRGFRFGDGIFETITIFQGIPYLWEYHLNRLVTGLKTLHINANIDNLYKQSLNLITINNISNGILKIIITRGNGGMGYNPVNINHATIFIETTKQSEFPKQPVALCISEWQKPSKLSLPTHIKSLQGLNSILSKISATNQGCFEAISLNYIDHICEVSAGNIFWYKNNTLYTPDLSCGIIPGIMRQRIIELYSTQIIIGKFFLTELEDAEEVFITNVIWQALPVKSIKFHNKTITLNNFTVSKIINTLIEQDKVTYREEETPNS